MVINMVKNIKVIHPNDLLLVKIGSFYHAYGRDAYILSYLFGYKIITVEGSIATCGFPIQGLNRVIATLEQRKINYLAVDRKNNYETDLIFDYGNLNTYQELYEKAKVYVNYKRRIEDIQNYLLENIQDKNFKEILSKMEEVINERRKV